MQPTLPTQYMAAAHQPLLLTTSSGVEHLNVLDQAIFPAGVSGLITHF